MDELLIQKILEKLAPEGITPRKDIEARYPKRKLSQTAEVTRICPSPTGFVHIGTIYAALLDSIIAHQSNGIIILRIEDTDKKRELPGASNAIVEALNDFNIHVDESIAAGGDYGPYLQSLRSEIYLSFVAELLRNGRAYPCFASKEELEANVADQQAKKVRPGYYGAWAPWRDRNQADIEAALDGGQPFVIRFKSLGSHESKLTVPDMLKGDVLLPENDLDVPLIKSDEHRLPTYHLAHVVDDYLMGATLVLRGDEWLPSTPLHFEIADALNITRFKYAHIAPISIIGQTGGKRKLSKRKDPEADVKYWKAAGYPVEAVKAYLLGLANAGFEAWWRDHLDEPLQNYPLSLKQLSQSRAPLLDMKKLEDYSKELISRLPQAEYEQAVLDWAESYEPDFSAALGRDKAYTSSVLAIERDASLGQVRKDIAKWSDAVKQYDFFFDELFDRATKEPMPVDEGIATEALRVYSSEYDYSLNKEAWFEQLKACANRLSFCTDMKLYKQSPENYAGSLAQFAGIVRIALTGKGRTPDLWLIMQIMGAERVRKRLSR